MVAAYSVHPDTGEQYLNHNYSAVADAPDWLLDYCRKTPEEKSHAPKSAGATASESDPEPLDIESLPIRDDKKALILDGALKGQRSEALISVIDSMLSAGCTDGQIFGVMDQYPIGEKYREKGSGKKKWLSDEIGRARGYIVQDSGAGKKSKDETRVADQLFEIGSKCELFSFEKSNYARINNGNHSEVHEIGSREFKDYLSVAFRHTYGKRTVSKFVLDQATQNLIADASYSGREERVFLRVADHNGRIYVDLCDAEWRVVEIDPSIPNGWQVITHSPVNFIRKDHMHPLPLPEPGSDISEFRQIINCPDDNTWKMVAAWILGALNPESSYPILVVNGEQGSAKTHLSRFVRSFVDPSQASLCSFPPTERDLYVMAKNNWILGFDNIQTLTASQSRTLCCISTGGAMAPRKNYSDDGMAILNAKRPVILNGINNVVRMPDLLDRSIIIDLPAIPPSRRKLEADIRKQFHSIQPRVMGALYSAIAHAMANRHRVITPQIPRMADFAVWVTAAEGALGWVHGDFMEAYKANRVKGSDMTLEDHPVARAIMDFMDGKAEWDGYVGELFTVLNALTSIPPEVKSGRFWPKIANKLTENLTNVATTLRDNKGIDIQIGKPDRNGRPVKITTGGSIQSHQRTPEVNPDPFGNNDFDWGAKSEHKWLEGNDDWPDVDPDAWLKRDDKFF